MIEVLQKHWGYSSLRAHQGEIVHACLAGKDCFVVMATGSGKSLCYQLPVMLYRARTKGHGCVRKRARHGGLSRQVLRVLRATRASVTPPPPPPSHLPPPNVPRTTIVVSPLVSLMEDQVMALNAMGIPVRTPHVH